MKRKNAAKTAEQQLTFTKQDISDVFGMMLKTAGAYHAKNLPFGSPPQSISKAFLGTNDSEVFNSFLKRCAKLEKSVTDGRGRFNSAKFKAFLMALAEYRGTRLDKDKLALVLEWFEYLPAVNWKLSLEEEIIGPGKERVFYIVSEQTGSYLATLDLLNDYAAEALQRFHAAAKDADARAKVRMQTKEAVRLSIEKRKELYIENNKLANKIAQVIRGMSKEPVTKSYLAKNVKRKLSRDYDIKLSLRTVQNYLNHPE